MPDGVSPHCHGATFVICGNGSRRFVPPMIHDVANRAKAALPDFHEQRDCESWLAKEFNKEILKELSVGLSRPARPLELMP